MRSDETKRLEIYLDEVAAHLGRSAGRREMLLELRSAILDRAEDIGEGTATAEAIEQALRGFGDPFEVAAAYAGERYLIGPRLYRHFWIYTGFVFAAHLVMIVVASVAQADFELFPVSVGHVAPPFSILGVVAVAIQALLMDIGLMVLIFGVAGRVRRTVRLPSMAFRVDTEPRRTVTRAVLTVLVLILLNFLRDDLFIVWVENHAHPLFSPTFAGLLPFLNAFLLLIVVREIAYAVLGERRWLVAADGFLSLAGCTLMIWLLTRPTFVAVPQGVSEAVDAIPSMNVLIGKVLKLLLIAFAVIFGVEAMKRAVRWRQL